MDMVNQGLFNEITSDFEGYTAKMMSVSYEIDRGLMIPQREGTTDQGLTEYKLPIIWALNSSVER